MQLARRSFLHLSALGTASLMLPLASGCGGPSPVSVNPGGAGEHLYFDAEGGRLALQPLQHRVLLQPANGGAQKVLGGFGLEGARLNAPSALVVGAEGRICVSDRGNHRVQVYARDGRHLAQFGQEELSAPAGLCVDFEGTLFVADPLRHVVHRFSAEGRWLGVIDDALNGPVAVAFDLSGRLHVVEVGNARVSVFSSDGRLLSRHGGRELGMVSPRSIAVDPDGNTWIADTTAAALFAFSPRGELLEHLTLTHAGAPAAPVHVVLGPDRTLQVATLPGAPV